jgi:hypothetical protein
VCKLRDEREAASRDAAVLRGDLEATRQERDRLAAEVGQLREEVDRCCILVTTAAVVVCPVRNSWLPWQAQDSRKQDIQQGRDASSGEGGPRGKSAAAGAVRGLQRPQHPLTDCCGWRPWLQAGLLEDMRGELALVRAQTSVAADAASRSYADNDRLQVCSSHALA